MKEPEDEESVSEILARLSPLLEAVFAYFQVSEEQARQIVEESCFTLLGKRRLRHPDPDLWLMQSILEGCRRLRKEGTVEDPPE